MAHTDSIADMLTRIRNAVKASRRTVDVPASRMKKEIARILTEKRFISKFVALEDGKQGVLRILLNYNQGESAIQGISRVSTPGRRIYKKATEMPRIQRGLGIAIVSTPKGIMTDKDCRTMKVGGEVLCKVW